MGVGRGVVLSVCSAIFLRGQASAPVAAFSVHGVDFRSLMKGRTAATAAKAVAGSRMPRALSSASETLGDSRSRRYDARAYLEFAIIQQ